MKNIKHKNILVTGAKGFVGSNLVSHLSSLGYPNVFTPSSIELNLLNSETLSEYLNHHSIHIILHLAGKVGGIGINKDHPGSFFYENALMGINVMHQAYLHNVEKVVSLAAGCGYPSSIKVPFSEKDFWNGLPDMNSYGYSLAKKNLIVQSWGYKTEYDFNSTVLLPANLYGPHDNFDLDTSHVVPALVRKFLEGVKENSPHVEVWGSGKASREFLYVDDAVRAIIDAIGCSECGPFNLGTGVETPIKDLVAIISELVGYEGLIKFDTSRPDGQRQRFYDMASFESTFGYTPSTDLRKGLSKTINWYKENEIQ
tara:strand:- start:8444 stop:9382 length:939 start_codon:yes stop_codon:yes gene_type:complete